MEGLPIQNPDNLVIGADRDNVDPSKRVTIKVSGREAVTVGRVVDPMATTVNLFGIGIGVGFRDIKALIDFGGANELGSTEIMRVRTNEAGTADFGWTLAKYAGSNGETRQDNQFCWGYNVGPAGNKLVASEHLYGHCIENRYKTAGGATQLEEYNLFIPGDDCVGPRCFAQRTASITPDLRNGFVINRFEGLDLMESNVTKIRLDSNLSFLDSAGTIYFHGTRTSNDLIVAGGLPILSFKFNGSNKLDLFATDLGDAEIGLFGNSAPEFVSTLTFGGIRGLLNPNAPGFRKNGNNGMQFSNGAGIWQSWIGTVDVDTNATANKIVKRGAGGEINTSSVKVGGVKVVGAQCPAIPSSNGSTADNRRTINSLLACLRTHGVVAP
ncbi:MAG TPA: hypothetical protein VKC61_06180 [Pyrinomonadaceae bacterium]|nr:hypothetical protein [Pyrinomonadaceae bacterium]